MAARTIVDGLVMLPELVNVHVIDGPDVNMRGMQIPAAVEDFEPAKRTMAKLAALRFEIACFGHGPPIIGGADAAFRRRWLTE